MTDLHSDDAPSFDDETPPSILEDGSVDLERGRGRPIGSETNPGKLRRLRQKRKRERDRAYRARRKAQKTGAGAAAPSAPVSRAVEQEEHEQPDDAPPSSDGLPIPKELLRAVARIPLEVAARVKLAQTDGRKTLLFPEETQELVTQLFDAWMGTVNIPMTPGWALLGAYAMAFATARTVDAPGMRPERDVTPE